MSFNLKEINLMKTVGKMINNGTKEIGVLEDIFKDKDIQSEAKKEIERLCKLNGVDLSEIKRR
jgi:hypothetical protein